MDEVELLKARIADLERRREIAAMSDEELLKVGIEQGLLPSLERFAKAIEEKDRPPQPTMDSVRLEWQLARWQFLRWLETIARSQQ